MSSHSLFLVPTDPEWQPTVEAVERTVALLRTMAQYPDGIDHEFFDKIQLFHPYANWDGAKCPACGNEVEDWFHDSVGDFLENPDMAHLRAVTPCCATATSLNDLDFAWPCGFGRFVIEGDNAGAVPDGAQVLALEASLGTKLRVIWQCV